MIQLSLLVRRGQLVLRVVFGAKPLAGQPSQLIAYAIKTGQALDGSQGVQLAEQPRQDLFTREWLQDFD